jgi:hypothetical protein
MHIYIYYIYIYTSLSLSLSLSLTSLSIHKKMVWMMLLTEMELGFFAAQEEEETKGQLWDLTRPLEGRMIG